MLVDYLVLFVKNLIDFGLMLLLNLNTIHLNIDTLKGDIRGVCSIRKISH